MTVAKPSKAIARKPQVGLYAKSKERLKLRDGTVRNIANRVRSVCPHLKPVDAYLLRRFAELEYLASRCYAALRDNEITNGKGESKRLLQDYRRLVLAQLSVANSLGLTVAARAALCLDGRGERQADLVAEFARDAGALKQIDN